MDIYRRTGGDVVQVSQSPKEDPFALCQNFLWRECNSILEAIGKGHFVVGLHVEFSKEGIEMPLNGLFVAGLCEKRWKGRAIRP